MAGFDRSVLISTSCSRLWLRCSCCRPGAVRSSSWTSDHRRPDLPDLRRARLWPQDTDQTLAPSKTRAGARTDPPIGRVNGEWPCSRRRLDNTKPLRWP